MPRIRYAGFTRHQGASALDLQLIRKFGEGLNSEQRECYFDEGNFIEANAMLDDLEARLGLDVLIARLGLGIADPDVDPTPWCAGCGSMTKSGCDCGPIAEND